MPELKIKTIKTIEPQKVLGTKFDHTSKDVRLDIAVIDKQDNFYDIEMQVTKNKYLGKRLRYYQSSIDRDTLDKGLTYMDLKNTYLIFICPFDPFNCGKSKYSFHLYDDEQRSLKLQTNAETIIINSKGSDNPTSALHNFKKKVGT